MKSEPTDTHRQPRELSSDCNTLQLTNGKATSLMGLADNQISTNSYLSDQLFLRILFKLLNPCPLSLMLSILLAFAIPLAEPYTRWMYIIEFGIIAFLIIFKEQYFDKMRSRADEKVNQSRFLMEDSKVFRNGEEITGLTWGDIEEGDVLYLEKGEKAPADLLLLDTQHIEDREAIVYVDARSITGKVTVERKKACYLTQVTSRSAVKRNWDRYRKEYLSGKLKYEQPNSNMENFLGYLKLVKDPKTSLLTFENFIARESVIKTCWVYALVLNAGMNCKIMRHIGQRARNHRFFQNNIDRIFAGTIVIDIVFGLIFGLLTFSQGGSVFELIAYHLAQFSVILPHFLFFGNGLLLLYFSLIDNLDSQIINYSSLINLGSIDFAVLAYNGVLSSGKMNPDQIITSTSLYDFREQCNESRGSRRNGSRLGGNSHKYSHNPLANIYNSSFLESAFSPAPLAQRSSSEFDNYFLDDETRPEPGRRINTGLHCTSFSGMRLQLQPLRISRDKLRKNLANEQAEAVELVKALALCHQAILKSQDSRDIKFEANSKVYAEEVLLKLVNALGVHVSCQIDPRTKKQSGLRLKLQEGEERQWFFSRTQNNFQLDRDVYSVVVRQEGKDKRFMYCKGPAQDMLERLKDKEARKGLSQKLNSFRQDKAEIIIYGRKEMGKTEYQAYENEFTKLKMICNITHKEIEDFSRQFEQNLDFVCLVGLSAEKNEPAKEVVDFLGDQQIKMCVFANNLTEIQSLKSLFEERGEKRRSCDYIQLEGRAVEQITYNLNMITRKLNYESQFRYSLILGAECWGLLKAHSSLMQHFLLAVYYAQNILTHGLTPQEKGQITEKLKRSYNRTHTLMSIGSSYSDLLFENYSDVSLIISNFQRELVHSDIPSDIRAPNIGSLKRIVQLGKQVSCAYSQLVNVSVYRSALVGMMVLVLQTIVFAYHRTSYSFNSYLMLLYVVLYGAIQTVFVIMMQQRRQKVTPNNHLLNDKKGLLRFWSNLGEGILHGLTISLVIVLTLPNARLPGGKIFPVEAIHFSIYFLMLNVSVLRHLVYGQCSLTAVGVLTAVSYVLLLGAPWICAVAEPQFFRTAVQIGTIWRSYDSVLGLINVIIFCLASSLFVREARRKGIISLVVEQVLRLKKDNVKRSRQLLQKDIGHVDLVRHLFQYEDSIEESIQDLVAEDFDTNELKITPLLEIKKPEHRIKSEFNNATPNLKRFQLTISLLIVTFLIVMIHGSVARQIHVVRQIPLILLIFGLLLALVWSLRFGEQLGRKYYIFAELCSAGVCILTIAYEVLSTDPAQSFLLTCFLFIILTQMVGLRLELVLILNVIYFVTATVDMALGPTVGVKLSLLILLMGVCGAANIYILYGSTFDSRKNFILRQQIEMQTNQTNDIWTILVPQFVRNFFAENDRDGGQYKQKNVAILFCYVCNFDAILEEQGRHVVRLLDNLYREFDKICSNFAVQKIETVGYTYMAATGIRKIEGQMESFMVRKNKVERLLSMAQQMLQKTKLFKWGAQKNKDLDIKVGIHVGEVVVGVIGKHKKQFSLIGTNVNTTSRHCSTSQKGTVTLSKQAREELHAFPDEAFSCRQVYMKGLCKTKDETIPVFTFKNSEAARRTHTSSVRGKFKRLVMKLIRSLKTEEEENSEDEANILAPYLQPEGQYNPSDSSKRTQHQRITCSGLENNFNKIEEMKNRQDQIKGYSALLQFSPEKARSHLMEAYPSQDIQNLLMKQTDIEEAFSEHLDKNKGLRDKLLLGVLLLLNLAYLGGYLALEIPSPAEVGLRSVSLVLLGLLLLLCSYINSHSYVTWIFVALFAYLLAVEKVDEFGNPHDVLNRNFSHYFTLMNLTIFTAISGNRFVQSLTMGLMTIIFGCVSIGVIGALDVGTIYQWFYVCLVLIRKYVFQRESIINFRQSQKTAQISKELSTIVSELLPKHAYEKLKTQNFENRLELTDQFEQCTILFADIKGFTEFSDKPENREEPANVVRMLRSLFQEFDVLCTLNNVYKLYTIGDCYVVLGFTNCYDRNPKKEAENVVNFAFEMIKMIEKVKREKPELSCLNMRIGVHTGTIIGGIVGTQIVRYDIYGSDVVVANKFEETGEIGKVHISEVTKKLLDQLEKKPYSENNIEPSEKVEVKRLNVSYDGYLIKRGNLS